MGEKWRSVVGYEGRYEVSDMGNVRSIFRKLPLLLRPSASSYKPYLHITLSRDGSLRTFSVHRLVAEAFLGPANGLVCCHNNGDATDNRATNLRWDTMSGNLADRDLHGTDVWGEKCGSNKYTLEQVAMVIRSEVGSKEAKALWGMSQPTYSAIRRGRTWNKHPARFE